MKGLVTFKSRLSVGLTDRYFKGSKVNDIMIHELLSHVQGTLHSQMGYGKSKPLSRLKTSSTRLNQ